MSSEAPSNNPSTTTHNREALSNKRIRVSHATAPPASGNPAQPAKSPLQAAAGKVDAYVKTLHTAMQDYVLDLLSAVHQKGAAFFWKNKKHQSMIQDSDYIPGSVKFEVPLNAVDEVKQSEDYTTLAGKLQAKMDRMFKELAPFALQAHDLNRKAFLVRWRHSSYYNLLASCSRLFIAKHSLTGQYTEHAAIVDLLVKFPDEVTSMLNDTVEDFLRGYREHQELAELPQPTDSNHDIADVIRRINTPPAPAAAAADAPAPAAAPAADAATAAVTTTVMAKHLLLLMPLVL